MKLRRKTELIFWMLTLGALPAWANNPPQPDGVFSLILIFPVVIIGFRLAGVVYTERDRKWHVLRGLLLGLAVIISLAGTELAMLPLLLLLMFGLVRGVQIIIRGHGYRRIWVGAVVCLWSLFAVSDYFVSLAGHPGIAANEVTAVVTLRTVATAEDQFSRQSRGQEVELTFGTFADLLKAGLIDTSLVPISRGYRFTLTLSDNGKEFFISAVPVAYGYNRAAPAFIPGESWLRRLGTVQSRPTGMRSFAVDESQVFRFTSDQLTQAPTREEAREWKPLQ